MGCQRHVDSIVDIEPFRVMIHFFCQQGCSRHERPSLVEIHKFEVFGYGVSTFHLGGGWFNSRNGQEIKRFAAMLGSERGQLESFTLSISNCTLKPYLFPREWCSLREFVHGRVYLILGESFRTRGQQPKLRPPESRFSGDVSDCLDTGRRQKPHDSMIQSH